jgi:hypothetical protein
MEAALDINPLELSVSGGRENVSSFWTGGCRLTGLIFQVM